MLLRLLGVYPHKRIARRLYRANEVPHVFGRVLPTEEHTRLPHAVLRTATLDGLQQVAASLRAVTHVQRALSQVLTSPPGDLSHVCLLREIDRHEQDLPQLTPRHDCLAGLTSPREDVFSHGVVSLHCSPARGAFMPTHFGTALELAGPAWTRLSTGKEAIFFGGCQTILPRTPSILYRPG